MNPEAVAQVLSRLSFREAVWLFPFAFTIHVIEELPQFIAWARRNASPQFTRSDYLKIHIAGIVAAFIAAAVVSSYPSRVVIFAFFTFIFTPSVFYNTLFHAGATAYFGEYCPGVLTALVLYLPLYAFVTTLACRQGLMRAKLALISFSIAGVFHVAEVGRNVFKAW